VLFGEILAVALGAIRANKLRSFLTTLGIVIGVGAVITMVALGSGAQKAVSDQIAALGTNLLSVFPGQMMMGGFAQGDRVSMKVDDALALMRDGRTFANVLPELQRQMQVKYSNKNGNIRIIGSTADYPE
jgi:putative ABC transport system permease protein